MTIAKQNGDVIPFVKQKDYIMVNNDLGWFLQTGQSNR